MIDQKAIGVGASLDFVAAREALILAPADDPHAQALGLQPDVADLLAPSPEWLEEHARQRAAADGLRLARALAKTDAQTLGVALDLLTRAREEAALG